jgi:hypothetical protein
MKQTKLQTKIWCDECPDAEWPDLSGSCSVGLGMTYMISTNRGCKDWETCKKRTDIIDK